jgi:hypothetical protein
MGLAGKAAAPAIALALAGCAAIPPEGPSVMVLPGSHSNFNQFRSDDHDCRDYAAQATGVSPGRAAADSAVNSAAAGAAVGAAAGALIGAAGGDAAAGAAMGAGTGLLVGGASGAGAYGESALIIQDRYDVAYIQCMYAKGHQVPVPAGMASGGYAAPPPPGPTAAAPPPPPPPRR